MVFTTCLAPDVMSPSAKRGVCMNEMSQERVFRKGMDVYESEGPKCDLERKLHLWRREVTEWERGLRRTEQSLGTQENDQVGQKAHDPSQLQGVEKEVA